MSLFIASIDYIPITFGCVLKTFTNSIEQRLFPEEGKKIGWHPLLFSLPLNLPF